MNKVTAPIIQETDEHYIVPEEAFHLLPQEWREQLEEVAADGRSVLRSVDQELSQVSRLCRTLTSITILKHIKVKLLEYKFQPEMDSVLELETLTTAFVVTYARICDGGSGSGFSRKALPERLRQAHDQLIEFRNKRYAHHTEHHTTENQLEITLEDGNFRLHPQISFGVFVGGANEWHELVDFIENLIASRFDQLLQRLSEKTGRKWILPSKPN